MIYGIFVENLWLHMHSIKEYQQAFIEYLKKNIETKEPINLYEPVSYILELGGKRLRPVLILMTSEIFGTDYKEALDAALAVEVFHNFSLVHDDIMDDAPLRRGKNTVHEKWDINTGILSGDVMLIIAYQFFEEYDPEIFRKLAKLFSKTAIEVCEGQQYDVDFENRDDVTISEYLKMITYKTAVLVGAAMKMGAIIAKANEEDAQAIYNFGLNLGIAFQLQDDYLDAFGDPKTFGKQVGGDIIENKKTFLYLKTLELTSKDDAEELKHLFSIRPKNPKDKITSVKHFFENSNAAKFTQDEIVTYTEKAFSILETLNIDQDKKQLLRSFGESLMNRTT